jgi:hypothetical protein
VQQPCDGHKKVTRSTVETKKPPFGGLIISGSLVLQGFRGGGTGIEPVASTV